MAHNPIYIATQIRRFDHTYLKCQSIQDIKWRIASHADLIDPENLSSDGTLTPAQEVAVDAFIAQFRASADGSVALSQVPSPR